jgi:hypothetical protein
MLRMICHDLQTRCSLNLKRIAMFPFWNFQSDKILRDKKDLSRASSSAAHMERFLWGSAGVLQWIAVH